MPGKPLIRRWRASILRLPYLTIFGWVGGLFLALQGLWIAEVGLKRSVVFEEFPADGIFQLFDPLRRLADGQIPGHDFQFFHGLGVMLIHYPLFWLLGGDIEAAQLARWILSPALFIGTAGVAFWLIFRKWQLAAIGTALFVAFSRSELGELLYPGNSLLSIRTIMPLVVLLVMWAWRPSRAAGWRRYRRDAVLGLLLAAGFIAGTEHGAGMLVAFMLGSVLPDGRPLRGRAIGAGVSLAGATVGAIGLFIIISGRFWIEPIRYALVEVPADQFWYFGAPPNPFIGDFGDIFRNGRIVTIVLIGLIMLAGCLYLGWRRRSYQLKVAAIALIYALLTTITALTGIYGEAYITPLLRVEVLVGIGLLWAWLGRPRPQSPRWGQLYGGAKTASIVVTVALLLWGLVGIMQLLIPWTPFAIQQWQHKQASPAVSGVELDGPWRTEIDKVMSVVGDGKGGVWSLYAGIPEVLLGTFQPSGYDYIIHALGPERRGAYTVTFAQQKPKYVVTLGQNDFPFNGWLQNEHWDIQNLIARNYELASVPTTNMPIQAWRRTSDSWNTGADEPWTSAKPGQRMSLGRHQNTTVEVELTYDIKNPAAGLPVFGKLPRYLVGPEVDGSKRLEVSLIPYRTSMRFPVYVTGSHEVKLASSVRPNWFGAGLTITGVRYRELRTPGAESLRNEAAICMLGCLRNEF